MIIVIFTIPINNHHPCLQNQHHHHVEECCVLKVGLIIYLQEVEKDTNLKKYQCGDVTNEEWSSADDKKRLKVICLKLMVSPPAFIYRWRQRCVSKWSQISLFIIIIVNHFHQLKKNCRQKLGSERLLYEIDFFPADFLGATKCQAIGR